MVSFFITLVCALRFLILLRLLRGYLDWERHATTDLIWKKHKNYIPILSFGGWGLFMLANAYWGVVRKDSVEHPWFVIQAGSDLEVVFLLLLAITVLLSYLAVFRYGQWAAAHEDREQNDVRAGWHAEELEKKDRLIAQLMAERP